MKIDMHVHTCFSRDCDIGLEEIFRTAKRRGLDGIAITDHNEIDGALKAKRISKEIKVIPGEEVQTREGEIVAYFLKKKLSPGQDIHSTIQQARQQGALISIAHPLDNLRRNSVNDISVIKETINKVDFIELNGRSLPLMRKRALLIARIFKKPLIAGSDAHTLGEIGYCYTVFPDWKVNSNARVVVDSGYIHPISRLIKTKMYKTLGV